MGRGLWLRPSFEAAQEAKETPPAAEEAKPAELESKEAQAADQEAVKVVIESNANLNTFARVAQERLIRY